MSSTSPSNGRALVPLLRLIAHPGQYRVQLRVVGGAAILAAAIYFFFGTLALVGVVLVGGVAARYVMRTIGDFERPNSLQAESLLVNPLAKVRSEVTRHQSPCPRDI